MMEHPEQMPDVPATKPDPTEKVPDEHSPKPVEVKEPKTFRELKEKKDREREEAVAAVRTEYEAKLAEAIAKAAGFETDAKNQAERLTSTEALKAAHEAKLAELEQRIVGEYEVPYSLEVDPEATPVFAVANDTRQALDAAVAQAATTLGEDARSVELIFQNKMLFAEIMATMMQGLSPDAVHANKLVEGLSKIGVMVPVEEARLAVRELKAAVPQLQKYQMAQQTLARIKEKNEPEWQQTQAARHEAYRRHVLAAADVADDAADGDDATLAGILKARPELRDKLKAEADRLSGMVIGPAPGKATAATVRAAPRVLHETALKAARLPVALDAYRTAVAENAALTARIAELEARVANQNAAVPKPGGSPSSAGGKVDFNAALAKIFSP